MIKKLMMLCVAAMAAMGAMAAGEKSVVLGDWYEAHSDNEATTCARWDDFWMGASVAIPVTGLASPISASDVVVTAGTYSEFGRPYVLTEAEMWNRYGAPVLREKNLGNVEFDWYDNVWQNWDAEEDGAYGYELSADIWPNWSQVSGRQWILIPTGVPRSGTHTFSVKINGVEHSNYVVSFVMAEDQEPVPYVYTVSAYVAEGCEAMGKVTGGKTAKAGTKVTLKATANKGYAFIGWYDEEGKPFPNEKDYRIAQLSYTTGHSDVNAFAQFLKSSGNVSVSAKAEAGQVFAGWYTDDAFVRPYISSDGKDYRTASMSYPVPLYAALFPRFVSTDEDMQISLTCSPEAYYDANSPMSLGVIVDSCSLPTVTAANLPAGLKFDAKTLMISGTPTKPGEGKDVKFTVKNLTNKKGETFYVSIKIGDAKAPSLPDLKYNAAEGYEPFMPGASQNMAEVLGASTMDVLAQGGWTVTGLPAGMKYDPRTGKFSGVPTKANENCTVTFKKGTETATITLRTKSFPVLELEPIVAGHDNEFGLPLDESVVIPDKSKFALTGAGSYIANKEVTLGAKAPAGWVFAGWQEVDSQNLGIGVYPADMNLDSKTNDTRVAAYKFKMPATERMRLRGVFIHQSQDRLSPITAEMSMPVELYAGESIDVIDSMTTYYVRNIFMPNQILSSFPSITAKGLPAGLKFDAKNLLLSGKVTAAPGYYYATFAAKNLSGYTFTVPVKFLVHKPFEEIDPDVKDPADIDTIPEDWRYQLELDYLTMMNEFSPFTVGYVPSLGMMSGGYEPANWGYMIPEDFVQLGFYDKSGYLDDITEYGITSISGLPNGVALEKDSGSWTDPDGYKVEYAYYETKEGAVPTTPGWTRFTLSAKNYDRESSTVFEGKFSKMLPVYDDFSCYVFLKVVGEGGAVAGGGVWNAGKQYTITAVPAKNYSFAGWYIDPECTMPAMNWTFGAECDYRVAKQKWTVASLSNYSNMGRDNGVHTFYAKFIPNAEVSEPQIEILGYDFEYEPMNPSTWAGSFEDGSLVLNIENYYDSISESDFGFKIKSDVIPQVSITGLPKNVNLDCIYADGLTCIEFSENFDGDTLLVPGIYQATLTIKINSKTFAYPFTINVGNKKSGLYGEYGWLGELDYSKDAYPMDVGCSTEFDFLAQPDDEDFVVTVKGLPAGMKWDPETGIVSGTPTKTGVYTITVLTTCYGGEFTEEDTVTMTVNALPDWVVGTFYGKVTGGGDGWEDALGVKFVVSREGKVTAKLIDAYPWGGAPSLETSKLTYDKLSECYMFSWECSGFQESYGECRIKLSANGLGCFEGYEEGVDEDDDWFYDVMSGYQDVYSLTSNEIPRPSFNTADKKMLWNIDEDGGAMLIFGAKGSVSVSEPGHNVDWSEAHLLPIEYDPVSKCVVASLWLMGYDEGEDATFGAELILSIPVSSDGTAKASEIVIEQVNPGPNW